MAFIAADLAVAGVSTSVRTHWFVVEGHTARQLVSYMNQNAIVGDHGHAYASIHPSYSLSFDTTASAHQCRVGRVDVRITFDLTLPKAANPGAMGNRTRRAWESFAAFARSHEAHHQASYTDCARRFTGHAKGVSAPDCSRLRSKVAAMFSQMQRQCEARQVSFDRSQARVLPGLSLFSLARSGR